MNTSSARRVAPSSREAAISSKVASNSVGMPATTSWVRTVRISRSVGRMPAGMRTRKIPSKPIQLIVHPSKITKLITKQTWWNRAPRSTTPWWTWRRATRRRIWMASRRNQLLSSATSPSPASSSRCNSAVGRLNKRAKSGTTKLRNRRRHWMDLLIHSLNSCNLGIPESPPENQVSTKIPWNRWKREWRG